MQANLPEHGPKPPRRRPLGTAMAAGFELVVSVLVGIFGGKWADEKLGSEPWLSLLGFLLGVSVGLYQLIRKTSLPPSGRS